MKTIIYHRPNVPPYRVLDIDTTFHRVPFIRREYSWYMVAHASNLRDIYLGSLCFRFSPYDRDEHASMPSSKKAEIRIGDITLSIHSSRI